MEDTPMKTVTEKLHGIHYCHFTTQTKEGLLKSRPMGTQEMDFDGTVWFMTSRDSEKAAEIAANSKVGLSYAASDGIRFISMSGDAALLVDQEKIKEFWNDYYKAWFSGPEDPNITLIRVDVKRIEYWDHEGGKVGAPIDIAKAALTSDKDGGDENEVVRL